MKENITMDRTANTRIAPRGIVAMHERFSHVLSTRISHSVLALVCRFGIGAVFFLSGRTKVDGLLTVNETAYLLFEEDYRLPLIPADLAAHIAAYAEHVFPLLLFLGFATRYSALALLGMTVVIQLFVYPDAWPTHLTWAAGLLYLAGRGAGIFSVDSVLRRRLQ